jgi:hypothetical protein
MVVPCVKCKSITFSRLCLPIEFLYMLGGIILDRVDSINDLRVIMDSKMSFPGHIHRCYGWKRFGNAAICEEVVV